MYLLATMHSVTETDSIMMPIAYNTAFSIYDWLKFLYKSLVGRRYNCDFGWFVGRHYKFTYWLCRCCFSSIYTRIYYVTVVMTTHPMTSRSTWKSRYIIVCLLIYSSLLVQKCNYTPSVTKGHPFSAPQHVCYSALQLSPVRLSILCTSVRSSHGWISQRRSKLWSLGDNRKSR